MVAHHKPRVLVVEDDPDTLVILRINLTAAGIEPMLASVEHRGRDDSGTVSPAAASGGGLRGQETFWSAGGGGCGERRSFPGFLARKWRCDRFACGCDEG